MEKTNIRYVTSEQVPEKIDFASVDVSFISLKKVLGPARELLQDDARMVCLIKPQFEAGREKVGKKGVVYLVYIRKRPEDYPLGEWPVDPAEVVERAHAELAKG